MDFFEKNNFTGNGEITLERLAPEEDKFSLLFRDKDNKVVGCGTYDPTVNKDKLFDSKYWQKKDDHNYYEMIKNEGFFFVLCDNHFYWGPVAVWSIYGEKCFNFDAFGLEVNQIIKERLKRTESFAASEEKKAEKNDPLKSHIKQVIERLERIADVTRKDPAGWNYLEIPLHKIESDISTLTGWMTSGMDGHRMAIYNNLCEEYDCNLFEK